jgi:3-deoxy-manno-octulosonate cytidylyltransferase (CMP-KDO synthetase)
MNFTVIIPARAGASRLPGKPLLDIAGKPMVVRTAEQASRSNAQRVVVATDDDAILTIVQKYGFDALLTRADHPTGTDRLAEAAAHLSLNDNAIVVNVQGDEPLIDPEQINLVADLLARSPQAAMATCAAPIRSIEALFDPNAVKVVCNQRQQALYFSRAPIPWARDALADGQRRLAQGIPALHHIGLYSYRVSFLKKFPTLPIGPLETFESLEQLRALENGYSIVVHTSNSHPAAGVDTEADLMRVRQVFSNRL